jgi:tetratricopeptide (TPR) repeat protein
LWLGDNLWNQALSLYRQGRLAEAQSKVGEALQIYRKSYGMHYDNYPTALIIQGLILNKAGKLEEGEGVLREAVKLRAESLSPGHFWIAIADSALSECLTTQRRFAESEPLLVESYRTLQTRPGPKDPRTTEAQRRLVRLYELWNRPESLGDGHLTGSGGVEPGVRRIHAEAAELAVLEDDSPPEQ